MIALYSHCQARAQVQAPVTLIGLRRIAAVSTAPAITSEAGFAPKIAAAIITLAALFPVLALHQVQGLSSVQAAVSIYQQPKYTSMPIICFGPRNTMLSTIRMSHLHRTAMFSFGHQASEQRQVAERQPRPNAMTHQLRPHLSLQLGPRVALVEWPFPTFLSEGLGSVLCPHVNSATHINNLFSLLHISRPPCQESCKRYNSYRYIARSPSCYGPGRATL